MADGFPVTNGVTTLIPPPEGYVVDFDNPQSQSVLEHYLVFGILAPIALTALVQRLYTKIVFSDGLKIDDYLMIIAWVCSITMQSVHTYCISIGGLGYHAFEMPIETWTRLMIGNYVVSAVFILANGTTKASLFFAYLKISPEAWYRRAIITGIVMVFTYTVVIASLLLFGCRPIPSNWDPYTPGVCVNLPILYMAIATSNVVSDVVLFVIPIPMVLRLKMQPAVKLGAIVMFAIGSLTVTTSVVRMVIMQPLLTTQDIPWVAAPANVWSFVEVNLFIICGSMPTLRRFFNVVAPKWVGSLSTDHSENPNKPRTRSSFSKRPKGAYAEFGVEMTRTSSQDEMLDEQKGILKHTTVEVNTK